MAKAQQATIQPANLNNGQATEAISKLEKRLNELSDLDLDSLDNQTGSDVLASLATKINSTLRQVFGPNTYEFRDLNVDSFEPRVWIMGSDTDISIRGNLAEIRSNVNSSKAALTTAIELLKEQVGDTGTPGTGRTIKAYEGLSLHPEIERASSRLYLDGHYANAVEASVKALNGLVRLRSELEFDGSTLMERAFNPSNPTLKFNYLLDQSDKDEQKGFMMMFSGAVAGLRNPRAHGFIEDDPERALEFIAFVSLLAKLLDGAARNP
ncbi:TIGR02391 family protein [Devosia epidermidihirudinis]|uniref:TIGR02391 family protein n=1 Tax=Devosia epidermidihirudinis TaxID=1293439 RepID=UPI000697410D|nr:TIGR02391 family protein [Devosia epidermidihirudinis]